MLNVRVCIDDDAGSEAARARNARVRRLASLPRSSYSSSIVYGRYCFCMCSSYGDTTLAFFKISLNIIECFHGVYEDTLLFLMAAWLLQIWRQLPTEFEFGESLLELLAVTHRRSVSELAWHSTSLMDSHVYGVV